jgi:hypothetical protein
MILSHRRSKAAAVSVATLLAGVIALLGADYGLPIWIQVPLYLWMLTLGIPTTLTVILLATVWGRFERLYGLNGFMAVCFLVAPAVHGQAMEWWPPHRPFAEPGTRIRLRMRGAQAWFQSKFKKTMNKGDSPRT